jgi:Inner membrane protein YgaP-like, transmembrane domain
MNPNISKQRRSKSRTYDSSHDQGSDQQAHNGSSAYEQANVGEMERQLSLVGGTVLVVCGLLRGSLSGLALAGIGGALIWRGHTGHCEVYHMLGHSSAEQSEGQQQHPASSERLSQHDESHAAS